MIATPERNPSTQHLTWHLPKGPAADDFQPIACSDEGIVLPWPRQNVPLRLDKPGESWCPDCLALARQRRQAPAA